VVCIGAGPPGVLLLGWLAESLGAATALAITSSCGVLAVLALCVIRPELVRRGQPVSGG
jgi:hypothetical protein